MSETSAFANPLEVPRPADHNSVEAEEGLPSPEGPKDASRSLWSDAWYTLRRKPIFWISMAIIITFVLMAVWPSLFTSVDPDTRDLTKRLDPPESGHWFGFDRQGRDVYSRTIYGARISVIVGVAAALGVGVFGGTVGVLAGYFGGWVDALLSRIADMFFGLPFILGAIVVLSTFSDPLKAQEETRVTMLVIVTMIVLAWPQYFRVMRSSVLTTKHADYVQAARALGAGHRRLISRHILPNAIAPLIVMATISLGVFIGLEATLSFLGVGLRPPIISWGVAISDAQEFLDSAPHMLLFPAGFLAVAVLGFVLMGEAVREALDPKLR